MLKRKKVDEQERRNWVLGTQHLNRGSGGRLISESGGREKALILVDLDITFG